MKDPVDSAKRSARIHDHMKAFEPSGHSIVSGRTPTTPRGKRPIAAAIGLALAVAVVGGTLWALNREHPSVVPAVQPGVNGAIVWTGAIAETDSPADVGVRAADPGGGAVIRVTNATGARDRERPCA